MADLAGLVFSVSHTTRAPRPGEVNGRDYHFVSREEFAAIKTSEPPGFLEWAEVHTNMYGTSRMAVEEQLAQGYDVVLDIDVQGAMQVKESAQPVLIFIAPPSMAELERRLRGRGTESEEILGVRLQNARKEMEQAGKYDYLVVNDSLAEAVESLRAIIIAERCRHRRTIGGSSPGIFL